MLETQQQRPNMTQPVMVKPMAPPSSMQVRVPSRVRMPMHMMAPGTATFWTATRSLK